MSGAVTLEWRAVHDATEQWDRVAARYGTFFHCSAWLDALQETQPGQIHRLGLYDGHELVGILPVCTRRMFPLTVAASPMIVEDTPYLGIACDESLMSFATSALERFARSQRWHFVRLMQARTVASDNMPASFSRIEKHTHVLDLARPEDVIFKGMEGRCRTAIRKAEKHGIVVALESSLEALDAYYDVLEALYRAQGMATPNSREFYRALWQRFGDRELLMLVARVNGEIVAGALVLCANGIAHYLSGASRFEFNHLSPNNLVQWHAIQAVMQRGAVRYDFVGSDIERLAKFKKSFGGNLVTYSCLEYSSASWVRFVREKFPQAKSALRRIRRSVSEGRRPLEQTPANSAPAEASV